MKIVVQPSKRFKGKKYEADSKDLPGMLRVGCGATPEEAVADFMREQMASKDYIRIIREGGPISVEVHHEPVTTEHTVVLFVKALPEVSRPTVLECLTNVFAHHTPDLLYDVKVDES